MIKYTFTVEIDGKATYFGEYDIYSKRNTGYFPSPFIEEYAAYVPDVRLHGEISAKGPIRFIEDMLTDEYRDRTKKKNIYRFGPYTVTRESAPTDETFYICRCGAEKGEPGFSEIDHSCPHREGPSDTDIQEWPRYYLFRKMDDGTYQAELDEAWYWGGPHLDGGVIRADIPEEWSSLPYEEFLANVLTLANAAHYKFTIGELLEKAGLRQFFGYPPEAD